MNKNQIKAYAPVARKELIAAVTAKAHSLGLSATKIEPIEVKGDVAIIAGRPFARSVAAPRHNLEVSIKREGFEQLMERIAFTWFNRFSALRYMEIHGFLDHGYRVLSHPKGGSTPEILEHATDVDLPGLDKARVAELRLAGNKDAELYRVLLTAQCNALNTPLPFLFERTNDETELLLPDNLLHSDSPIRKLVDGVEEADWAQVEIIGWLYQFYISEKKDAVIGKVVASADIPAATQLFTPNWIVKYLVQNTLGRQWLATYPQSPLRGKMEFYIEPAEQIDEVKAQLNAMTPTELSPEKITFLDPACGSGHILVEAYDLFKEIYVERGYRTRDIPRLILEKNLFGLDIDERAAQLASFALMMKARADERGLFKSEPPVRPNVLAIQESNGLDGNEIAQALLKEKVERLDSGAPMELTLPRVEADKKSQPVLSVTHKPDIDRGMLDALLTLFENAKTFGSLIRVPESIAKALPLFEKLINQKTGRDLMGVRAVEDMGPLLKQARLLSCTYDHVIANPPYMGNKGMNSLLRDFAKQHYANGKTDLFSMFVLRNVELAGQTGFLGFVTPFVWLFIGSYEDLRNCLFSGRSIMNLVRPSYTAFFESAIVPLVTFVVRNGAELYKGDYFDLGYLGSAEDQPGRLIQANTSNQNKSRFQASILDFRKIPSAPIAYWVSDKVRSLFCNSRTVGEEAVVVKGLDTCDNNRFIRLWHEVSSSKFSEFFHGDRRLCKWVPYCKGGDFRKWSGNLSYLVDWEHDGLALRNFKNPDGSQKSRPQSIQYYFQEGATFNSISSSYFSVRHMNRAIFGGGGNGIFSKHDIVGIIGLLNSSLNQYLTKVLNPTMNNLVGDIAKLPFRDPKSEQIDLIRQLISLGNCDWNRFETAWEFQSFFLVSDCTKKLLMDAYNCIVGNFNDQVHQMTMLETENNRLFIEAYSLTDEMSPNVPEEQITLTINPKYRYGAGLSDEEYQARFRLDTTKELLSYAVGCMMGRYSLDKPGLIYANAGNEGFDHSQYKTFPADDDGIVPVSDIDWFADDATPRLVEFIRIVFGAETLDENLAWIAASFDPKKGETPVETIRRYFSAQFFKNHMQMYKKRPVYWLFSSGKQRAFECLVYLHRYNESTLSRMRAQYVTPLQGKLNARVEHLRREIDGASSAAAKNKLRKEVETLAKKEVELAKFDEELRHYADQRIKLDLDDGVRVNYGKFGALLAETKHITGGDDE